MLAAELEDYKVGFGTWIVRETLGKHVVIRAVNSGAALAKRIAICNEGSE